MTGHGKEIYMSNKVRYELLQKNENTDISESKYSTDSERNVTILSYGEESVSNEENENISDEQYHAA
jgi:hypothetical protein